MVSQDPENFAISKVYLLQYMDLMCQLALPVLFFSRLCREQIQPGGILAMVTGRDMIGEVVLRMAKLQLPKVSWITQLILDGD